MNEERKNQILTSAVEYLDNVVPEGYSRIKEILKATDEEMKELGFDEKTDDFYTRFISKHNVTSHGELREALDEHGYEGLWDYPEEEKDELKELGTLDRVTPITFDGETRFYEKEDE